MRRSLLLLIVLIIITMLAAFPLTGGGKEKEKEKVELVIWWWGESEAQGLEPWMNETVPLFEKEYPNIKVEAVLQSIEQVFAGFQAAVEAKEVPDIQFFFGGIWCLEQAFLGNVQPFSKYFTEEELDHLLPMARLYTTYKGDVYGFPFYVIGMAGVYNKKLFAKAGLDPNNLPKTWDEWMSAGKKLRAAGVTPYGIGDKDQYSGGELMSYWGSQEYDSILDIWKPVIGLEKYTDPKHMFYWKRLEAMVKAKIFNDDVSSLDHYQGHELFVKGTAATTWTTQPELVRWEQQLGADTVGVMQFPVFGKGKLANTVGGPVQVLGIPTLAKHPEEAALFLKFMHRPDRVKSMYEKAYAIAPTDIFDPAWIKSDVDKKILDWIRTKSGPWYQYLYPTQFEAEAVSPNTSNIFTGTITAEEAAKRAQEFMEKWRADNPTLVQAFKDWMESVEKEMKK